MLTSSYRTAKLSPIKNSYKWTWGIFNDPDEYSYLLNSCSLSKDLNGHLETLHPEKGLPAVVEDYELKLVSVFKNLKKSTLSLRGSITNSLLNMCHSAMRNIVASMVFLRVATLRSSSMMMSSGLELWHWRWRISPICILVKEECSQIPGYSSSGSNWKLINGNQSFSDLVRILI